MTSTQQVFWIDKEKKLSINKIAIPKAKENEVLIKHSVIGINFIDYEYYKGIKKMPITPMIPGIEGVGTILELGSKVKTFEKNQRVAYATVIGGGYSEWRSINEKFIVPVPEEISNEAAASYLAKGMIAHSLLRRTFFVQPEMTVLIHNATSTVGSLLIKLATHYEAKIIATVSNDNSEKLIEEKLKENNRCLAIINYNNSNWVKEISKKVNVVYDSVGGNITLESLDCLLEFGLLANYGSTLGDMPNLNLELLAKKSLFVTSPRLINYKKNYTELLLSAMEIFELIKSGVLPNKPENIYQFNQIPQIMKDIETRKVRGSKIVKFS